MQRCSATTPKGIPCKAWATRNSDPPRCAAHANGSRAGAPPGNTNAQTHGAYSTPDLPTITAQLARRLDQLAAYIDGHLDDLEPADYARLGTLQGQLVSRLARLIRDQSAGGDTPALATAINEALDLIGAEIGVDL